MDGSAWGAPETCPDALHDTLRLPGRGDCGGVAGAAISETGSMMIVVEAGVQHADGEHGVLSGFSNATLLF